MVGGQVGRAKEAPDSTELLSIFEGRGSRERSELADKAVSIMA